MTERPFASASVSLPQREAVLVLVALLAAWGLLTTASAVWLYAIKVDGGEIHACVDCLGEGWVEVALFVLATAATTVAIATLTWRTRQARDAAVPARLPGARRGRGLPAPPKGMQVVAVGAFVLGFVLFGLAVAFP